MLFTTCSTSGSRAFSVSAAAKSPIACSGCRRSWPAAAKNWVLERLAISASVRARSAASFARSSSMFCVASLRASASFSNRLRSDATRTRL